MQKVLLTLLILLSINSFSQENISYQKPSSEILDLVEFDRPPSVIYDNNKDYLIFLYRSNYKTIEELSTKELRLAGLRINPKINIGSRITYYNNIKLKDFSDSKADPKEIVGMPKNPKVSNLSWSPNEKKIAFTNTTDLGVDLWILDLKSRSANKIFDLKLPSPKSNLIFNLPFKMYPHSFFL